MSHRQRLRHYLALHGTSSSADLQRHLQVSQATVSPLIMDAVDDIIVCGKGKATRYALAHFIGASPSQQPIWMVGESGLPVRLGSLSFLSQSQIHIDAGGVNEMFSASHIETLPWYPSTL